MKYIKKVIAVISCSLLIFSYIKPLEVFADASSLVLSQHYFTGFVDYNGISNPYKQFYPSTASNSSSAVTDQYLNVLFYKLPNSSQWNILFWLTASQYNSINNGNTVYISVWQSQQKNGIYTYLRSDAISNTYTANDQINNVIGTTIYYYSNSNNSNPYFANYIKIANAPRITLSDNTNLTNILYVLSMDQSPPYLWEGTTSSGGMYWSDGTELSPENTSKYENIFIVMDSNDDNSITEEEVNYYNYTYNTNYDYSVINEGNNFDENQFLYWVATIISGGNDNPGGGTGSGSNGSSSGGISIGDGSFTQTQQQTIEENAVNVTVNNNNELSQENMQSINQIINQSVNTGENNPFEQSIGNMNQFLGVAQAFSALAAAVLGFLPWWVTALLTLMFTILFVMVIFRLIHLFV